MALLEVRGITKRFGGLVAVENFSFNVEKEEILGLIGPNGAGKTTAFNVVTGFYRPDSGTIRFKGEDITGLKPHEIAQKGIGRTFQITRVFRGITTLQNMLTPYPRVPEKLSDSKDRAVKILEFFDLIHLKNELAGNLSGGQQKLLELARASMFEPELYLLDEPFYGIHPALKNKIIDYIKIANERRGIVFVIVSHDIPSIMGTCEKIVVMSTGKKIAEGSPKGVRNNKGVIEAYLGV